MKHVATAFLGISPALASEARQATLELYRCLLKASRKLPEPHQRQFVNATIRERFRFHRHETSRSQVLKRLSEGNKAYILLNEAQNNSQFLERIDTLARGKAGPLRHVIHKLDKRASAAMDIRSRTSRKRDPGHPIQAPAQVLQLARISIPKPYTPPRRKPKFTRRKPYQVAIKARDAAQSVFMRVRGWRQPARTSMMIKARVKKLQQWMDEVHRCQNLIDIVRKEKMFYANLKVPEDLREYGK
ncbi:hypothetical protein BX666DRAFT_1875314 [Dichotomocladium elegans]|nr:hypothetical protein BX666DRAFT_1875314 [Dichotomocladium elegans]